MRRTAGPVLLVLWSLAVFSIAVAMGTQHQSPQSEGSGKANQFRIPHNLQETWWQRASDPVATFTFCLVVVGSFQLGLFLWQLRLIRESLDDAKIAADAAKESADAANRSAILAEKGLIAAQRAWIKIERITVSQPLVFTEAGVSTAISIRITNIGNAPALKVSPHAWLYVLKRGGGPNEDQRQRCQEVKSLPFTGITTLFPNETFPDNTGFGAWSFGIGATRADIELGIMDSRGTVSLYVGGCIDYSFPIDPTTHHQTRFLFDLRKNHPDPIHPQDGTIPANGLSLLDTIFGDGRSAD